MKLFALTVDFAFKALFAPNPDLLMDLLNSFPSFQEEKRITSLKVLNPEIPKEINNEKLSILDIHAENQYGEKFIIEIQAFPQGSFTKRVLYYWSKMYSRNLKKSLDYKELKKVYSINFVKYSIWKEDPNYLSTFYLLEKDRNLTLTEDLEIHIVELDKFIKKFDNLKTNLETWVYLLKESSNLKGEIVKSLEKKNPSIKKAISELKNISRSPKNRGLFDARKKAEMDHFSIISEIYDKAKSEVKEVAYKEGLEKGIEEGIQKGIQKGLEGIYLGIQLNLETRFQIQKSNPLIKEIHKIKDIELLKEILIQSVKAKNISELKKKLKFIKN